MSGRSAGDDTQWHHRGVTDLDTVGGARLFGRLFGATANGVQPLPHRPVGDRQRVGGGFNLKVRLSRGADDDLRARLLVSLERNLSDAGVDMAEVRGLLPGADLPFFVAALTRVTRLTSRCLGGFTPGLHCSHWWCTSACFRPCCVSTAPTWTP
jgi:hypothetical protein